MAALRGVLLCVAAYGAWNLVSLAFVAPRPAASSARACSRVAMRGADNSGAEARGPVYVYMNALMDAAAKSGESVPVTKDVMQYKKTYELMPQDLQESLSKALNKGESFLSEVEKAEVWKEQFGPWESTVFPKFMTFLAKKRRLTTLFVLSEEYVAHLYQRQSIAPVTVTSAMPLSEEQTATIKQKMAKQLEVNDIKLIQKIDRKLLSGFKIEWGYTDPENPVCGTESIDLSLSNQLEKAKTNFIR